MVLSEMSDYMKFEEICKNYIDDKVLAISPLGDGHINDTFLIETEDCNYVLQKLSIEMDIKKLEYNYNLYSEPFEECDWSYPKWLKIKDEGFFHTDINGDNWRMYHYISGDAIDMPMSKDMLYACGSGLARMHAVLKKINGKPKAVFPHLHDLRFYYDQYTRIISENVAIDEHRDERIEKRIKDLNSRFTDYTDDDKSIIHGDTKVANALFKDGQMIGFLDFDTVMTGSINTDIADCIRSCCFTDGVLDQVAAESFIEGYISISPSAKEVTSKWKETLRKICYLLAIRYYTDEISGENYFKEKYSGYRLEKATELLEMCICG